MTKESFSFATINYNYYAVFPCGRQKQQEGEMTHEDPVEIYLWPDINLIFDIFVLKRRVRGWGK